MFFEPNFMTTLIGSVPYTNTTETCNHIIGAVDIPVWPQMIKLDFRENMYMQYSAGLPSIVIDEETEKITFNIKSDFTSPLEDFYTHYLEEDVDYFGLQSNQAAGFFTMLAQLEKTTGRWVKGQVTGPISTGLTITDQDLRSSLYHQELADVLVKNAAMNARWQIRKLRSVRPDVIISVDEPYMASFGSAFINRSLEQVISMLDEVFESIHAEDGLAGVHCCANTDWSVLLATQVDILNLDAYGYLDNLALYPSELKKFLNRGGVVAWGIVPNNPEIFAVTPEQLVGKLRDDIHLISDRATTRSVTIELDAFDSQSLVTPACGLGPTTPQVTDAVLPVLSEVSRLLRL